MTTEERNLLAIWGDGKEHPVYEGLWMANHAFKMTPKEADKKIRRLWEKGWLAVTQQSGERLSIGLTLSAAGDRAFRDEQIKRGGDFRYYRYFNRTPESNKKWGSPQKCMEIDAVRDKLDMNNPIERQLYHVLSKQKQWITKALDGDK